jgi:hypothetical protein
MSMTSAAMGNVQNSVVPLSGLLAYRYALDDNPGLTDPPIDRPHLPSDGIDRRPRESRSGVVRVDLLFRVADNDAVDAAHREDIGLNHILFTLEVSP